MDRLGILGLDTSHAEAFASTLSDRDDVEVSAVWDSGQVRSATYVEEFCTEYGATRYMEPTEMVDDVDGVMVLTVDWDTHRDLCVPFLEAGVPTLVDKPLAGRLRDVSAIAAAAAGTPFFGGSALPYHPQVLSFSRPTADDALYCFGYDDAFYYGCHLADAVRRVVGVDWAAVRPAQDPGMTVDVLFENDSFVTIRLDGPARSGDFILVNAGGGATAAVVGSDAGERRRMYEGYLQAYLDTVRGVVDERARLFDGARLLLAIHAALSEGQSIAPGSDLLAELHVAGDAFVESYDPYY